MGEEMDREVGLPDVSFMCRMDKEQGPTVQHRELYSIIGKNILKNRMCKYM